MIEVTGYGKLEIQGLKMGQARWPRRQTHIEFEQGGLKQYGCFLIAVLAGGQRRLQKKPGNGRHIVTKNPNTYSPLCCHKH